MSCGQEMTFGYISMTELTLRTAHVLAGRINYPTGRILECHKLSYRVFTIGSLESSLHSSPRSAQAPFPKASGN